MLYNDENITQIVKEKAIEYLGEENVINIPKRMTSEDFAYFANKVPCCFYRLGTNNSNNDFHHSVHSPFFDVDEKAIEIGCGLIAHLIL
jgi:amidohydrolase